MSAPPVMQSEAVIGHVTLLYRQGSSNYFSLTETARTICNHFFYLLKAQIILISVLQVGHLNYARRIRRQVGE